MNPRHLGTPSRGLALLAALLVIPAAVAQKAAVLESTKPTIAKTESESPDPAAKNESIKLEKFVVTGSMIKRVADEGALPIQTITRMEIEQQGATNIEQMISQLNINGNALDNLASNADVVNGAQRGNNGATAANLRGQGSNATLILLNGRRVASHGLNGGVVDLNQIPMGAIERVEVLKDGASSTYGTDAVGGVINFILKKNFTGLVANSSFDVTEEGGGNIYRYSLLGGYGDLDKDKFNIMGSFSVADNHVLRGDQRDWNNTFQPDRGLSPDTRGSPIATIFAISSVYNILSAGSTTSTLRGTGPYDPANSSLRVNGINIVDLPTNTTGYTGYDGMGPYDEALWNSASAKYGSAWDTGRAAVLQQPVKNTSFVTRGSYKFREHILTGEAIVARSDSTKSFSPNQITSSTASTTTTANGTTVANPFYNLAYPSTGADYNRVYSALVAYFPSSVINYGAPIPFRWRALPGGNRELRTISDTSRFLLSLDGPVPFLADWDYRIGGYRASSKSKSKLLNGYYYTVPFAKLINEGILNPFSYAQTDAAMAGLKAASATGVQLYGGRFVTTELDATASGPLHFSLPGGELQGAIGLDWRQEKYIFSGDSRTDLSTDASLIYNAPFDNLWATTGTLKRTVKAVFGEVQLPVWKGLDLNLSGRLDDYTGFGRTTNPKVTLRYSPSDKILLRGSYSTGFRVPTFRQQYNARSESTYSGSDLVDPVTGAAIAANSVTLYSGGKSDLEPEDAKMTSAGIVVSPFKNLSFNVDWWEVNRTGTIQELGTSVILANYALFPDRVIRNSSGTITAIDIRPLNAGETITKGIEYGVRGDMDIAGGKLTARVDVSELLEKKSRLIASAPFGTSEIGRFTRASDIGLKWKYTASTEYSRGKWSVRLSKIYRAGYMDAVLPGVANGYVHPVNWNPKVAPYVLYNVSFSYKALKNTTIVAGVKNIFNTAPPFSAAYDTNTGAGSSWEPRVADPRDRSYTLSVEYKFL